ncbi:MAG TPA: TolC family protein [Ferruginibacter sp.]|nr:TolC family protein [Ferruginibacter sp.]HPH89919.1 TolC family protein [Ferruginibacter sp.]
MTRALFISIVLITASLFSNAQDTVVLSKAFILKDAGAKNLQVKIAEQSYLSAEAGYNQTKAIFLPNVNLSYTAITTTNPLMAFGSKINQEGVTMADFNPALINDPGNVQNFNTKLEVQQPLLNYDALHQRKAARAQADAMKLKMERSAEYVLFEIDQSYMQLQMAYAVVEVLTKAKQTALANQKLVTDYYNNGLLQKSELLNVQVRVTEIDNQLLYARSNISNASDYIHFLLNEPADNVIKPADTLSYNGVPGFSVVLNDSRKDIAAYKKALEAHNNMALSAQKKSLPRLNAFGSYELNDKRLYNFRGEGYLLGLQLSWNVFDGLKTKGAVQQAKANYRQAEQELAQYRSQSQLEINKTNRQLTDAAGKIDLAKQALEQSQEAYRIRNNRFGQGLEKTTDLLNAEMQVTQKQLAYHQAILEYNITSSYLHFLNK